MIIRQMLNGFCGGQHFHISQAVSNSVYMRHYSLTSYIHCTGSNKDDWEMIASGTDEHNATSCFHDCCHDTRRHSA